MSDRLSVPPIETHFDGHRFRSRLEARWAVFFKELGFDYEYELEGYKLPSGARYLPDFFLTQFNLFVEVKPHRKIPIADLRKVVEFALAGDSNLLLIIGAPTKQQMLLINRRNCDHFEATTDDSISDEENVENWLINHGEEEVVFAHGPFKPGWHIVYHSCSAWAQIHLEAALLKAKKARFEFGERG